jgi:hypothetical protein
MPEGGTDISYLLFPGEIPGFIIMSSRNGGGGKEI